MPDLEYKNPVYQGYFADPFVWRHDGIYYALGTGRIEAESHAAHGAAPTTGTQKPGVFLMLHSDDFVHWTALGAALESLPPDYGNAYWAPEVAAIDGKFWLYYSVGREDKAHHLRVAVSSRPEGPYRDTGTRLTDPFTCPFAIDASPFRDGDGEWYLFYARDFLDTEGGARAGTGVVVDRMVSPTKLAGNPIQVVRAHHDWQRFMKDRIMYGGVYDWHTIEGPCVYKRNGKYWCLYSAGRWENETYGVDYAVADRVTGPYETGDNSRGARVLHTVPGKVIGPGHNCVAPGPNEGTDYIVYHAWDPGMTGRRMFIDPIEWFKDGPRCSGPTYTPQRLR